MLNQDNFNKIKRILSAKTGTQVPKFQNASGNTAGPFNTGSTQLGKNFSKKDGKFFVDGNEVSELDYLNMYNASLQAFDQPEEGFESLYNNPIFSGSKQQREDLISQNNKRIQELQGQVASSTGTDNSINTSNPTEPPQSEFAWEKRQGYPGTEHLQLPSEQEAEAFKERSIPMEKIKIDTENNLKSSLTPNTELKVNIPAPKINTVPVTEDSSKTDSNKFELLNVDGSTGSGSGGGGVGAFDTLEMPGDEQGNQDDLPEKSWVEKAQDFMNSDGMKTAGNIASAVAKTTDTLSNALIDKSEFADDSFTNSQAGQAYDAVASSLMGFSPVGTIVGGAMKLGAFANNILGDKTKGFAVDQDTLNAAGGSYQGSAMDIHNAANKASKKYGLFEGRARRRANAKINDTIEQQQRMASIAKTGRERADAASIMAQDNMASYKLKMDGGYDQRYYLRAAKEGAKIQYFNEPFTVELSDIKNFEIELSDIPTLLKEGGTILDKLNLAYNPDFKVTLSDIDSLEEFKNGGVLKDRYIEVIEVDTTQKSVIPEGALHKNKHHLDEVGVDDSELTKKGIPVVDTEGDQQAEIELNEIIFTLEVTKELESRYKEFYQEGVSEERKNELALEAGKLLWKEIIYNTDDRTGLIDTLKQGGTLLAKEGNKVDDTFQKFLETLPDNQRNYSEDNYRMRRYWELNGKPKDFKEALEKGMFTLEDDGFYHAHSVAYNEEADEYEFMKMPGHKTTWMEEEGWYNGMDFMPKEGLTEEQADGIKDNYILTPKKGRAAEESRRFREQYVLDKSGPFWKYVPRKKTSKKALGGNITQDDINSMIKQALINLLNK